MQSETQSEQPESPFDLLPTLDERPGPAQRISSRQASAMVQAALQRAGTPGQRGLASRSTAFLRVAAAAAILLFVGGAIAAFRVWRRLPRLPEKHEVLAPKAPLPLETRVEPEPAPAPLAPEKAVAEPPKAAPPVSSSKPVTHPSPRRVVTPTEHEDRSSEDLLQMANEQRRAQKWREAEALYQRVLRAHPGTPAAYVAAVASAALRLEQLHDARGALRLYQAALRSKPDGSLAAEARYGLADTYHALSDRDGETRALREFLAAHADSPLRPRAEERLRKLTPPSPAATP